MSTSIPGEVVDWIIENDAIYRLYAMSRDIEHVDDRFSSMLMTNLVYVGPWDLLRKLV